MVLSDRHYSTNLNPVPQYYRLHICVDCKREKGSIFLFKMKLLLTFTIIIYIQCIHCNGSGCYSKGEGYELLFTSNSEAVENLPIKFNGSLPKWLSGTLVKNGMGQFEEGPTSFIHLLDGFAKITKISFTGSQTVIFSTNMLQSEFYRMSMSMSDVAPYMTVAGRQPPLGVFQSMEALYYQLDNTNVNIQNFPSEQSVKNSSSGTYVAISDIWPMYEFDINNLRQANKIIVPIPNNTYWDKFIPVTTTSHPIKEHNKPSYISFFTKYNLLATEKCAIHIMRIESITERQNIVEIPCKKASYMHSFALSKNYAILFVDPLHLKLDRLKVALTLLSCLYWEEKSVTRISVANINTEDVFQVDTEAGFHVHHVNSYENGSQIIIDYVVYPDDKYLFALTLSVMKNRTKRNELKPNSQLIRYIIDIPTKTVQRKVLKLSEQKFINRLDFPVINEMYRFKKYCYIYGTVGKIDDIELSNSAIVKKDVCQGKDYIWHQIDHYPMEPTFVANPHGILEDDGVILAIVLDGPRKKSYILVLNAKELTVISSGYLPHYVPSTLHGHFVPQ